MKGREEKGEEIFLSFSTLMHSAITEQHHFDRNNFMSAGGSFIASDDFFFS